MQLDGPQRTDDIAEQEKSTMKSGADNPTLLSREYHGVLDHVRSVLDPLSIPYEILVVDDDSRRDEEIVRQLHRMIAR